MREGSCLYGGASFLGTSAVGNLFVVEGSLGIGCLGGSGIVCLGGIGIVEDGVGIAEDGGTGISCLGGTGISEGGGIGGGIGFVRGMGGFVLTIGLGAVDGLDVDTCWFFSRPSFSSAFSFGGSEVGIVATDGNGGGWLAFSGMGGGIGTGVARGGGGSGG